MIRLMLILGLTMLFKGGRGIGGIGGRAGRAGRRAVKRGGVGRGRGKSGGSGNAWSGLALRSDEVDTPDAPRNIGRRLNRNQRRIEDERTGDSIEETFTDLGRLSPVSGRQLNNLGRRLNNIFRNRHVLGRGRVQSETLRARQELREAAIRQMEADFDELSTSTVWEGGSSTNTRSGIYNILQNGQRTLIGDHARPVMTSMARGGANGRQMYDAALQAHPAMEEAVGQTLSDLADAFDTMMDLGQTAIDMAQRANDN